MQTSTERRNSTTSLSDSSFSNPSSPSNDLDANLEVGRSRKLLGRFERFVGSKLGLVTAIAGLASSGFLERSLGATIATAADRPALETLAAAQDDLVWLEGSANGNTIHASGTLIRGLEADWVLTAAHVIIYPSGTIQLSNITVGNGSSYINDRGQTSSVTQMIANPTYAPGSFQMGDWLFLRLENRISSEDLRFTIGETPAVGTTIMLGGFGTPSSLAEGSLPDTGTSMAFNSAFDITQPASFSATMYDSADYTGLHDSGFATSRDSGGFAKYFNTSTNQWNSIGTVVATNPNSQSSFILNYNAAEPAFYDTLNNSVQPVVPEPSALVLAGFGAAALAASRRRR